MVDDKFKCDERIEEYAKRTNYEHAKTLVQKSNGCGIIFDEVKYEVGSIRYHSCFCTYRHPYFNNFLFLFKNYQRGILPFKGSLMEQPAYIIDIFNLIENLKIEHEDAEQARQSKRNNK